MGVTNFSNDGVATQARYNNLKGRYSTLRPTPQFVAIGTTTNTIVTSPDGITWTTRTGAQGKYIGMNRDNNYEINGNGGYFVSTDGITWTGSASTGVAYDYQTTWRNGYLYGISSSSAGGFDGRYIRSLPQSANSTGGRWIEVTPDGTIVALLGNASNGGIYYQGLTAGVQMTQTGWTNQSFGLSFGNGYWVACTASNVISLNSVLPSGSWTSRATYAGSFPKLRFVGNAHFIYGTSSGIMVSTDGVNFSTPTTGFGTSAIQDVVFGNGTYVVVGDGGKIATSTDLSTWNLRTSGTANGLTGVTFG